MKEDTIEIALECGAGRTDVLLASGEIVKITKFTDDELDSFRTSIEQPYKDTIQALLERPNLPAAIFNASFLIKEE